MKKILNYNEFKIDEGTVKNLYHRTIDSNKVNETVQLAVELVLVLREVKKTINPSLTKIIQDADLFKEIKKRFLESWKEPGIISIDCEIYDGDSETISSIEMKRVTFLIKPLEDYSGLRLYTMITRQPSILETSVIRNKELTKVYGFNKVDTSSSSSKKLILPRTMPFSLYNPEGIDTIYVHNKDGVEYNKKVVRKAFLTHILSAYVKNYMFKFSNSSSIKNLNSIINLLSKTKKEVVLDEEELRQFLLDLFESKYGDYFKNKENSSSKLGICSCPYICSSTYTHNTSSNSSLPLGFILDLISVVEIISKPFDFLMKLKDTEKLISEIAKESPEAFHKIEQSLPVEYRYKAQLNKDMGDLGF